MCAAEDVTTTESQAQKTETHPQLTREANAGAADAGLRIHTQGDRDMDTLLATELTDTSLQQWIFKRTVRVVDEITGTNFAYYESLRLPMLLLFVDKGQDNARVLADFKAVAKAYQGKVSFAYIDGKAHAARKVALGLVDDLLPALAFNTLSGALYPFPTHRALTQAHIKEHVEGFLSGRLHPTQASSSQQEVTAAQDEAERLGAHGLIEISHKSFQQVLESLRPPRVRHPIPFPHACQGEPLTRAGNPVRRHMSRDRAGMHGRDARRSRSLLLGGGAGNQGLLAILAQDGRALWTAQCHLTQNRAV